MEFSENMTRCQRLLCAFALGLGLLHGEAGNRLLPDLDKPTAPVIRDWDRQEPQHSPKPIQVTSDMLVYTTNSSPLDYTERFRRFGMDL